VDVDYEVVPAFIVAATAAALKIQLEEPEGSEQLWVPRSLVTDGDDFVADRTLRVDLEIQGWFARREGLA
jgi:hypothetical protein